MAEHPENIDAYLAGFPDDVREILSGIRAAIRRALPDATEAISYDIPTFKLHGRNVVHLAGWKQHVSLYPIPDGDPALERELEPYRAGKGTLRFRLGEPVPYELIARIATALAERR
ncbi:iron chaperone [Nocardia gipuzkoensis]